MAKLVKAKLFQRNEPFCACLQYMKRNWIQILNTRPMHLTNILIILNTIALSEGDYFLIKDNERKRFFSPFLMEVRMQ